MTMKISASAARIVAATAAVARPDPSHTTWSRLEPLPTSDDVTESLQARIADPLWMLARQWQFNEFQGEDAGSPISAALKVTGLPVSRLLHPDAAAGVAAVPLPAGAAPIEAMVEHEQVLPVHPKLNAQAGQQLMRSLRAAKLASTQALLLARYPAAIAAPDDPPADNAGFVWHTLLDARAIDALALAADLKAQPDRAALEAFAAGTIGIAAAQVSACCDVLERWSAWLADLALAGLQPGASPYWQPQRLEYGFALGAQGAGMPLRLRADEYADGRLDWYSYTLAGAPNDPPNPDQSVEMTPKRPPLPTTARYPGMPADRYWEFEDGRVNFGMMGAAKSDLARLAVLEYALVFGNDWFVLPLSLPSNALYRITGFTVRDNFGVTLAIPPALDARFYELDTSAGAPVARMPSALYLSPALDTLEGPPLEHVMMMRDEMANLVWGIEKRVQGTSGEPIDRKFESTRLSTTQVLRPPVDPAAAPAGSGPLLHYTLQTPVAANWVPFLPVRKAGATPANWAIQLQRGVVTHYYQVTEDRMLDPRNAAYAAFIERLRNNGFVETNAEQGPADNRLQGFMFHPRGNLLRLDPTQPVQQDFLRIEEEEVPRDGIELKRAFNYARDSKGRALLWIGRSKTTGRGEGASGLKFDVVSRGVK
ncbi:MAG TPA: hypothetical protein VIO33_00240 [Burkholderiaceae bacterium]